MESDAATTAAAAAATTAGCYGGGDIAGAVIGSLIGGIVLAYVLYRLYTHYWRNRKDNNLVQEDPENAKQEFAFDNPAFRNEKQKVAANSPLDTKWTFNKKSPEKRQTADETATAATRSVSLRGSDFTGLGIEICGGLKEGIYVKKVMPQGPAAQSVRTGDKIISITIDLQHMVQQDAATILSLASPYNVQLELIAGNGSLPRLPPSPASQNSPLSHPLYQANSGGQDDDDATIDTIEQNARRQLFVPQSPAQQSTAHDEIGNYPTLKLEAPTGADVSNTNATNATMTTTTTTTTTVHRENEKLQQHSASDQHQTQELHAVDAAADVSSSTGRIVEVVVAAPREPKSLAQADVETAPIEAHQPLSPPPPIVNKRTKHLTKHTTEEETPVAADSTSSINDVTLVPPHNNDQQHHQQQHLQRMGSITSSGIRRDSAGIPQEIPDQMFAAAMAARGNRKSTATTLNVTTESSAVVASEPVAVPEMADSAAEEAAERINKNRSKAPRPPARGDSLVENRASLNAGVVGSDVTTIDVEGVLEAEKAVHEGKQQSTVNEKNESSAITSEPLPPGPINIELNANHITVHHSSDLDQQPAIGAPVPNKRHHHEIRISDEDHNSNDTVTAASTVSSTVVSASSPVAAASAEPPSPKPRASIISLDSSLVEQVLAVADGFSQETRATLSRQLSELNEDDVPAAVRFDITERNTKYTDLDVGTQEEILNNYKFKAEPVHISMSSSQYQFEGSHSSGPASAVIAVSSSADGLDQADNSAHITNGHNGDSSQHDTLKMSYGINIPDDVKVSRYPFAGGAADRGVDTTLTNGGNASNIVPVFSSDGHGVNSISISSLDISADELEHIVSSQPSSIIAIDDEDLDFALQSPTPLLPETTETTTTTTTVAVTNGVNSNGAKQNGLTTSTTDVFIIESLSSMKAAPQPSLVEQDVAAELDANFVTEIQMAEAAAASAASTAAATAAAALPPTRNGSSSTTNSSKPPSPPRAKQRSPSVDRIPRNTEMKFTTATYESATQRHLSGNATDPKRQQAVDQIRSTFERGHTQSEIPVLVRRPSIPASPPANFTGGAHSQSTSSLSSLPRTSPSKIPVLGGTKSGYSSSGSGGSERATSVSGGSSTGHSPPVQARTNGNGFLYRSHSSLNSSATSRASVSGGQAGGVVVGPGGNVTVTAIKNSSRNPSGK